MPKAYYSEIDKNAAEWLRQLIYLGEIAPGDVDDRSIEDVTVNDLKGYTQCHFFAGVGVWSYALRHAGWPDSRPAWSGSAPCQGFSSAGKQKGFDDERHLWPVFYKLIRDCMPDVCFGEQVSGKLVTGPFLNAKEEKALRQFVEENGHYPEEEDPNFWLPLVQSDLEREGYVVGSVVTGACSVGAPHQRKRLYWVGAMGDSTGEGLSQWRSGPISESGTVQRFERSSASGPLVDSEMQRQRIRISGESSYEGGEASSEGQQKRDRRATTGHPSATGALADSDSERFQRERLLGEEGKQGLEATGSSEASELADSDSERHTGSQGQSSTGAEGKPGGHPADSSIDSSVADPDGLGRVQGMRAVPAGQQQRGGSNSESGSVADSISAGPQGGLRRWPDQGREGIDGHAGCGSTASAERPRETNGFWRAADWLFCTDGKWRPVKPGSFPLVDGAPSELVPSCHISTSDIEDTKEARVMRLKGYGNAIVAEQAIAFIEAFLESINGETVN